MKYFLNYFCLSSFRYRSKGENSS